jgi:hypothetical protein
MSAHVDVVSTPSQALLDNVESRLLGEPTSSHDSVCKSGGDTPCYQ